MQRFWGKSKDKSQEKKVEQESDACIVVEDEPEVEEVDFDIDIKEIELIKLIIEDFKEEGGRLQWNIRVEETSKDIVNIPKKGGSSKNNETKLPQLFNIKRTFSDFKWLLQQLRNEGEVFILPSLGVGSSSITTYYKTKILKDDKTFKERKQHLDRFLKRLSHNSKVVKSKPFQIFISKEREEFETFKKRYDDEHKSANPSIVSSFVSSFFDTVGKVLPISTDSEMSAIYKGKFSKIEDDVNICYSSMNQILSSHTQYLAFLKIYDPELTSADQKYNADLVKILNSLELLIDQIEQNKYEVGKQKNKQQYDRLRSDFQDQIDKYTSNTREELRHIASRLSQANRDSCGQISQLFREKFTIRT